MSLHPTARTAAATLAALVCCMSTAWAEEAPQPTPNHPSPSTCTYKSYQWHVEKKRSVNHQSVTKPYAEVGADERDPDEPRCSVCEEDQVSISLSDLGAPGLGTIQVCHVFEAQVRAALQTIIADPDFDIIDIVGYRPGKTRGKIIDAMRSEWSNHSFGTAIDINAARNGLYGACRITSLSPQALAKCKLRIGGAWDPDKHPRTTITPDSVVYRAFTAFWKWGGEISGDTRDLMHFSISGY